MTAIVPGAQIGNYRVESALERDEACLAFTAVHLVLPRRAVLKVMDDHALPETVPILREAYILEALQHPGVVRVYESGLLADRRPWSAREHVEGRTLESVLRRGELDRADGIALLRELAGVLVHAHERGVLHCGLRPSRVLVTGRSRGFPLCIADWSCARPHDAGPQRLVVTAESRPYTAPELAAGEPIDDRTDVFALGALAYRMLTGSEPYEDRPVATAPDGATYHVPTVLRCPEVPRELAALVDQMLAFAREERPRSAEIHEALAWFAELLGGVAQIGPRIRRPRWTPQIAPPDPDPRVPIAPMAFGDGRDEC